MSNERLHEYHKHNEKRPVAEICRAAIDEMIAVIGRTTKSQATIRMTVPPQHDDSDTLIIDALYKGIEAGQRAEQAEALLRKLYALFEDHIREGAGGMSMYSPDGSLSDLTEPEAILVYDVRDYLDPK